LVAYPALLQTVPGTVRVFMVKVVLYTYN
jgi:hypothetical protein